MLECILSTMIVAPTEVQSIARKLVFWEASGYVSEGLVLLGCFGEYVADYAKWPTKWPKERKHLLGRRSLIALILGLAGGIVSLIQTNALSGQVIRSLGEQAKEAGTVAQQAIQSSNMALEKSGQAKSVSEDAVIKSGKAEQSASDALTQAQGARHEADTFERDIVAAKKQAA